MTIRGIARRGAALIVLGAVPVIIDGPRAVVGGPVAVHLPAADVLPMESRARRYSLVVHGDSIGVHPRADVARVDLEAALVGAGLRWAGELDDEFVLFTLDQPLGRAEIFELGRSIRSRHSAIVLQAGPLVRHTYAEAPLVATDQVVVRFLPSATQPEIDSLTAQLGARLVYHTRFVANHFLVQARAASPADGIELAERFAQSRLTLSATPNLLGGAETAARSMDGWPVNVQAVYPTARAARAESVRSSAGCELSSESCQAPEPDDSLFDRQWHLHNPERPDRDIGVLKAWKYTPVDSSITIAVMEHNGIDFSHPDLAENHLLTYGWDFSSCIASPVEDEGMEADVPECVPNDAEPLLTAKHGTAVAGVAAAAINGKGVTGVCPHCSFIAVSRFGGSYRMTAALLHAARMGVRVINLSAGPPINVIKALEAVKDVWPDSISVVVSAGDDSLNSCGSPAFESTARVIVVGASDANDNGIPRSNFGHCLTVLAPAGVDATMLGIATTDVQGSGGYNKDDSGDCPVLEVKNEDYTACFGGVSAATPIVAGVLGLMLSVNPGLTHDELKTILKRTAVKIDSEKAGYDAESGFSETHGYGRVNAGAAVRCAKNPASCPGSPP